MSWIPDLGAFQPVLGRKFHVESEFKVKNSRFKRPEGKNKEKRTSEKIISRISFYNLVFPYFSVLALTIGNF